MTDVEQRLRELEQRVEHLEDERAVHRLIAAYGPLVDSGSDDAVAGLWQCDGVYDVDEVVLRGQEHIAAMVRSPHHRQWIEGGCAHLVGPPHVTVFGDEAVATCHSLMVVHTAGGFRVRRATANRWHLRKSPDGWYVTDRTSRVLDGRTDAPKLLAPGTETPGTEER